MDAAVGTAAAHNVAGTAEQSQGGPVELLLHRRAVGLHLIAAVGRAEITQPQQQFQQMPMGISGRVVPNAEAIAANDVPMDGSVAFFPMQDMSQILAKSWNADGTIKTVIYKPFVETPSNLSTTNEKLNVGLSDDVTQAFMQRFDDISNKISQLEQSLTKPLTKTSTSKTKKEAGEA